MTDGRGGRGANGGRRQAPHRLSVSLEEHRRLPEVYGRADAHLVLIENRLDVAISARGGRVTIEGDPRRAALAEEALREIHRRAGRGEEVDEAVCDDVLSRLRQPSLDGIVRDDATPVGAVSIRTRRRTILPRTPAQARYMRDLASSDVVLALGPAGTGKTYLAVAQAVSQLIAGSVQRLVLSRPAVEAGERLGFLPGDMKEKVDPYLRPIYDALHDCLPAEQVERRIASGEIEIAPIAFMRGRTLADAFVLLDEGQNATPSQMKMFLTRFGQNSRMVVCGDPRQTDLPCGPDGSGLADAVRRLQGVEGIAISRFDADDVVRHPVVGRIVHAYEDE